MQKKKLEIGHREKVVKRVQSGMSSVSVDAKTLNTGYVASMNRLPDDLLVQILTFLPIKEAVSTSILSKRWRTLFTFMPRLDLDDSTLWDYKTNNRYNDAIQKSFIDFVDRTLTLQNGSVLKKLSMKYISYNKYEDANLHVDRWIRNALEFGVSELHLGMTRQSLPLQLSSSKELFSKTLVKLSMVPGSYFTNRYFAKMSLPALKVLEIATFEYVTDFSVFLAACPTLEEFTIHHNCFPMRPDVISSKSLKRLSFNNNSLFYDLNTPKFITLDTPSVVDLYYSDYVRHEYPNCNLDSLAKATLDLRFTKYAPKHEPDVTDLIKGICNVKNLSLTSSAVEVISICCKGGLPMFNNLVNLVFSSNIDQYRTKVFLPLLLEHSPSLESLTLSGLDRLQEFVRIPTTNQLKILCIMEYQGSAKEMKHISHFLSKMKNLEVVRSYAKGGSDKVQLAEDLSKLTTTSSKLKMQLF